MSGMAAASARLARSAYNIANVNTSGFQVQQVDAAVGPHEPPRASPPLAQASAQVLASSYHGEVGGVSSTDLTTESIQQISAVHAFKANLAMLRADDDRTRRLLNLKL
jgi:flagellar hook protein FlgE